jgi:hypothetical protein
MACCAFQFKAGHQIHQNLLPMEPVSSSSSPLLSLSSVAQDGRWEQLVGKY